MALYRETWDSIKFLNLFWRSEYYALLKILIARPQIAEIGCEVSYLLALAHGVCLFLHYPVCFAVLGLLCLMLETFIFPNHILLLNVTF